MAERSQSTPPRSSRLGDASDSSVVTGQSRRTGNGIVKSDRSLTGWNNYQPSSGPPSYPDTSYQSYLANGGNLLGIGYIAWRDKQLADYQTKYNLYQQWYESTAQQMSRITEAGLSPNLAYGMATPGSAAGGPAGMSPAPTVPEVAAQGAAVLGGIAQGAKSLVETASMLYELPESKFKGSVAKMLDTAAAAGAFNSGKQFEGLLNNARVASGIAESQAKREQNQNLLGATSAQVENDTLDYLTSHDSEGSPTDFESSLFVKSAIASKSDTVLSYRKHKAEWDYLLSNPSYYQSLLTKAVADGDISKAQAWRVNQILGDKNMDNASKVLALQEGVPGFVAKVMFEISSKLSQGIRSFFPGGSPRHPYEYPQITR